MPCFCQCTMFSRPASRLWPTDIVWWHCPILVNLSCLLSLSSVLIHEPIMTTAYWKATVVERSIKRCCRQSVCLSSVASRDIAIRRVSAGAVAEEARQQHRMSQCNKQQSIATDVDLSSRLLDLIPSLRYDTNEEFNVDSKAVCDQHVARKKYKKKKKTTKEETRTNKQTPMPT